MGKIIGIVVGVALLAVGGLGAAGLLGTGEEGAGIDILPVTDEATAEETPEESFLKIEGCAFPLEEFSKHALAIVDGKIVNVGKLIFYREGIQDFIDDMPELDILAGLNYGKTVGWVTRAWVHENREVHFEGLVLDSEEARRELPFAQCCIVLNAPDIAAGNPGEVIKSESASACALRLTRPGASGFPSTWVRISDNSKHAVGQPARLNW